MRVNSKNVLENYRYLIQLKIDNLFCSFFNIKHKAQIKLQIHTSQSIHRYHFVLEDFQQPSYQQQNNEPIINKVIYRPYPFNDQLALKSKIRLVNISSLHHAQISLGKGKGQLRNQLITENITREFAKAALSDSVINAVDITKYSGLPHTLRVIEDKERKQIYDMYQQQLQKLVDYYEKEIAQQKLQRHYKTMQNIQINEFEGLKSVLKEKEKQLETVTNRLNASQCEKTAKYDTVKTQRRERILFSNQFNGFQNQLFDLEYKYKQFLIERVLLQRIFEEKQLEFTKVRTQWEREIKRCEQESHQIYQQQVNNIKNPQQSLHPQQTNNLAIQPKSNPLSSKQTFYRSRGKIKNQKNQLSTRNLINEMNEKKIVNLSKLKLIKDLLNKLEVDSFQQLKQLFAGIITNNEDKVNKSDDNKQPIKRVQPKSIQRLELLQEHNQSCTQRISKLQDEIYEWNKTIDNLQYQIQHHPNYKLNLITQHKSKGYNNYLCSNKHISQTQTLVQQLTQQLTGLKKSISNFNSSQNLQTLIQSLGIQQQQNDLQSIDSHSIDVPLLALIQDKLSQLMEAFPDNRYFIRSKNDRRSLISWEVPHLQHQQKDSNIQITQKSINPFLGSTRNQKSKKQKTIISRQISSPNGLKKLSNLLKSQSKTRGSIEIVSKDQMIKQATQAFGKEGITKIGKFQVKYT